MPTFPSNVGLQLPGYGRQAAPIVERSDMERGPAKTRRFVTDPVVTVSAKLFFRTEAIETAFDDWYYSAAGANAGAAWVDWTDPKTGTVRQVRLVSLGVLSPISSNFGFSEQPVDLEYVRQVVL